MNVLLAFSMFAFPALGIAVMEFDNWRRNRADRDAFSLIDAREAAQSALRAHRRTW